MEKTYDVCVIGAGIIGLSCAYYLANKGKSVAVLEAGGFAHGASGACDDMILFQSKKPGINLELAFESLELYRSLRGELDSDLGFENYGGMVLIENNRELEIMEQFVSQQRNYGLDVEILDKKQMLRRQPLLSERYIASTYSPLDSQADPFEVMHAFSRKASRLGADILYRSPVTAIEQNGRDDYVINYGVDGSLRALQVVNAAGAWAGSIALMVDETVPIKPKRGQILITEKIPMLGETNLWSARYLVTKLSSDYVIESTEEEKRLGLAFALTRSAGSSYLIGSTREFVGYDKGTTMEGIRAIIRQACATVPTLKDVHFIRAIAGLRPATPDGKMILGEHSGRPGFFTAAGHEGDGISLAPVTGKMLAALVCGDSVNAGLKELSPDRFTARNREAV